MHIHGNVPLLGAVDVVFDVGSVQLKSRENPCLPVILALWCSLCSFQQFRRKNDKREKQSIIASHIKNKYGVVKTYTSYTACSVSQNFVYGMPFSMSDFYPLRVHFLFITLHTPTPEFRGILRETGPRSPNSGAQGSEAPLGMRLLQSKARK